jgi:hypothetical protein
MSRRRSPLLEEARRRCELARALADQTARAMERSNALMDGTAHRLAAFAPDQRSPDVPELPTVSE